jgi:hypothetical protein
MKSRHEGLIGKLSAALSIDTLDTVLPHEEMQGCIDLKEAFPSSDPCSWMMFGNMGAWPKVAVDQNGKIVKICDRLGGSRWAIEGPVYKQILDNLCKMIRKAVYNGTLQIDPAFNEVIGNHIKQNFDWSVPALGPYTDDGYVFSQIFPRFQEEWENNSFNCFQEAMGNLKEILYKFWNSKIVVEQGSILSKDGWIRFAKEFVRTLVDCVIDIIREGIPA